MVFRSACLELHSQSHAFLCKGSCIFDYVVGVILEGLCVGFFECYSLCRHYVAERSAKYHWASLVYIVPELFFAENHCTAWTAEGLVGCGCYDVCPFYRVIVTCEHLSCYQSCKVCHVYHKDCTALVCY